MTTIFVDTNILLHAKPLQDITWEAYETPPITIVITKTNLRELDDQKDNHPKRHIRERARKALQRIEAALDNPTIRKHVTLVVDDTAPLIDFAAYELDPQKNDDQLLAKVLSAQQTPVDRIILYTRDTTPRIAAKRLGITAKTLPQHDELPPQKDEIEKENDRLKQELHELKAAAPQLGICINHDPASKLTATTLAPPPEPVDDAVLDTQARAARNQLPTFTRSTRIDRLTNVPGAMKVFAMPGITDLNEIPQTEHERYQRDLQTYEQTYRQHLLRMHEVSELRARTITLAITLENTGGKPAEDIDITITLPEHVSITDYAPVAPGPPSAPRPPQTNATLQHERMLQLTLTPNLPSYDFRMPNLNPTVRGPKITDHSITWWLRNLRHTYEYDLGTFYLTLPLPLRPFSVTYDLHATNAPKPFTGAMLITPIARQDAPSDTP